MPTFLDVIPIPTVPASSLREIWHLVKASIGSEKEESSLATTKVRAVDTRVSSQLQCMLDVGTILRLVEI